MYIDTHTHIHYPDFADDRDQIIKTLQDKNIYTILIGTDVVSSKRAVDLASKTQHMKAVVGFHPNDLSEVDEVAWKEIENLAGDDEVVVGIGETGLDLYRDATPENLSRQIEHFRRHIELAQKVDKPLVIHSREAFPEVSAVLSDYSGLRVIFHCFTGSREWMETLIALPHEIYFSYSGIVTFKNNVEEIREAAQFTPLDRILTETDSPYLAPVPFRGKRNDSTLLPYVTDFLAELRNVDKDEFREQAFQNAQNVFGNLI